MASESKTSSLGPLLFGGLILAAVLVVLFSDHETFLREALDSIQSLGAAGPAAFIAIYAMATVFLVPGSVLTIGAGWAFGLFWGTVWVTVAANTGALLAFLAGRHLARDWARRKIAGRRAFQAIDDAVESEGWKVVGLVRLSPVMPFNLVNYAFGLTKVGTIPYVVASIVGMIPGTLLYVYIGSVARNAGGGRSVAEWAFWAVGLAATVVVTIIVTKVARRKLDEIVLRESGSS